MTPETKTGPRARSISRSMTEFLKQLVAALVYVAAFQAAAAVRIVQVDDGAAVLTAFTSIDDELRASVAGDSAIRATLGETSLPVLAVRRYDRNAPGTRVVIGLDISGSMNQLGFDTVKSAVLALIADFPPSVRFTLVTIGDAVTVIAQDVEGKGAAERVRVLAASDRETLLHQGLLRTQEMARAYTPNPGSNAGAAPVRQLGVIVTDGLDDSKLAIGTSEMLDALEFGSAPLIVASLTRSKGRTSSQLEGLAKVARASGGQFIRTTPTEAAADLRTLARNAMQGVVVVMDCSACRRDGQARALQIHATTSVGPQTGERRLKLSPVAQVAEAASPASASPVSPPPSSWIASVRIYIDSFIPWRWFLAGLGLLLTSIAASGIVYREKVKQVLVVVLGGRHQEETRVVDSAGASENRSPAGASTDAGGVRMNLTLDVAGQGRQAVLLNQGDVVLGRDVNADVQVVKDREASQKHAALYLENGIPMVRDLGSVNGTHLNGTRIRRPEPLHDRDTIRIGRTDLKIYFGRL